MNTKDYSTDWFEAQYTYPGDDLGAVWAQEKTAFRLWAPTAQAATVALYRSGTDSSDDLIARIPMTSAENGTWTAQVSGNLNGTFYTYLVLRNGTWTEASDPYAHACGVNGKRSMVINLSDTNPKDWALDQPPHPDLRPTDYVIYELHIRDLTASRFGRIKNKGKYLGLTETGTTTSHGFPTGLDHIKALGVTHIHLLPVYDFGSVDEARPEVKQYNWGYDPVGYDVPEGSYATDPFDGFCRVREMKQMVRSLHKNGLSVVMDVVYNHVFHADAFSINRLVPGYFSREDDQGRYSNGSICGNDTASERSMVRKFIVDSVNFWAEEYHIDGFRFDLVGLLDTDTVNEIVQTVHRRHPHVFFYGEGWDMQTHITKERVTLAIQQNSNLVPQFAFFNDTMRDTIRGSVFDYHSPGYITGASVPKWHLLDCFSGRTPWTNQPEKIINYISCHDNHTLYDRIAEVFPWASEEEIGRRCRLGAAFNLLSMGVPFFQAGEEMLRRKRNRAGRIISNSYRSPDSVNAIRWNALSDREVAVTRDYYRGLISLRKAHPLFRMTAPEEIAEMIIPYETNQEDIAAFLLSDAEESILAVFHSGLECKNISLPEGKWFILVKDNLAGVPVLETAEGEAQIPPLSAEILCQPKAFC